MDRSTNSDIKRTTSYAAGSESEALSDFANLAVSRNVHHLPVVVSYRCGRALMKSCSFDSEEEFRLKLNGELTRSQMGVPLDTKSAATLERFARYLQQKDPMNLGDIDVFREWSEWLALVRSGSALVQHSAETSLTIAVALARPKTVAGFLLNSKELTQANVVEVAQDLRTFYAWLSNQVAFGIANPATSVIAAITQGDASAIKTWRQELNKF
jgi:hypothetical protein